MDVLSAVVSAWCGNTAFSPGRRVSQCYLVGLFQLTHQQVVNIVFVLSKQSFATVWACLGRFVSEN